MSGCANDKNPIDLFAPANLFANAVALRRPTARRRQRPMASCLIPQKVAAPLPAPLRHNSQVQMLIWLLAEFVIQADAENVALVSEGVLHRSPGAIRKGSEIQSHGVIGQMVIKIFELGAP